MSSKRYMFGLSAAVAIGLLACSDFTSSGDILTESEASELAASMVEGTFPGFGGFGAAGPSAAPGQTNAGITDDFNYQNLPCEGGGTVDIVGSVSYDVNQSASSATFRFDYTVAPDGCQVTTPGDKVFTLTGDPNLKANGELSFSGSETGGTFEGSLNYDGKFAWESSDGRAGACGVDLTVTYEFTWGTGTANGTATVEGSVCGVAVSRTVTVDV